MSDQMFQAMYIIFFIILAVAGIGGVAWFIASVSKEKNNS